MSNLDGSESVLCVKRDDVLSRASFDGFHEGRSSPVGRDIDRIIADAAAFYPRTEHLENNPALLQLIGYAAIWDREPSDPSAHVLVYRRSKAGAEGRLYGKLSIGIGGHTNPVDAEANGVAFAVENAVAREVSEELDPQRTDYGHPAQWVVGDQRGFIFDSEWKGVEAVHFGIAYDVIVPYVMKLNFDPSIVDVAWYYMDELKSMYRQCRDAFETWSQVLIERSILGGK